MMSIGCSLQFSNTLTNLTNHTRTSQSKHLKVKERAHLPRAISSHAVQQDCWCLHVSDRIYRPLNHVPSRYGHFTCRSLSMPCSINEIPVLKATTLALVRSYNALRGYPLLLKLVPSIGLIAFTIWGLGPLLCHSRSFLMNKNDANWKKSSTHYVFTSYLQPLLLWTGAVLVCRALDPVVLPTEASQVVKQRLLNFVRSLSTVLAFAYCISSLIQQTQKILMETTETSDARNMGFQFVSKAIYTAVWVAAISLFVELLGFSTQKWLTAGGLGTVLLTLAGREIFTNFLSSVMIHATRPFVLNEWIQTKIEGYEVSGTVEHVGWWSPTIIRGDDREAVHIPNHKFTVNVVRNLSQKTHWRVKTHFAISHLDANKISNIVADMRKVLAKNPQVEQQRLHRRVFLDYINPENQAFMILVSCFVKTSHFEEYLCVKEGILLDLLRVVSHHRARLATPIRTVQKIYNDMDLENVPFAETIITRAGAPLNRPLYLIESAPRINGDDKVKPRPTSRANEEPTLKNSTASEQNVASPISEGEDKKHQKVSTSADSPLTSDGPVQNDLEDKPQHKKTKSPSLSNSPTKTQLEGLESTGTTPNDLGEAHEKPPAKSPKFGSLENKPQHKKTKSPSLSNSPTKTQLEGLESTGTNPSDLGEAHEKPPANSPNSGTQQADTVLQATKHAKQETAAPPVTRPSLEDNIVLGMALDGSKRTLPIEEGMIGSSPTTETKELAGLRNGNGSPAANNNKGTAGSTESGGPSIDQQDQGK